jgi:hypothetical protein
MHSIRFVALMVLGLNSQPALAWEFTPGTPCVLRHETASVAIELTYDPTIPVYSISLTQPGSITPAPVFSMQFSGQMPLAISTDQHRFTNMGRTLTVTDSGFGNVLNGLQFNDRATAILGGQTIEIPLIDAADPVAAFRACDVLPAA